MNKAYQPLISIITPSYNQGKYLEEAIKSVITQDYNNVEYLVIDGGSTDNSKDIIRKYEKNIAYWHSRSDNGQSDAVNQGFRYAQGEIVAWLNADDMYMPGTVRRIASEFRKHPQTDLIYGDCAFVDESGNFIRYFTECEPYDKHRLLNFSDYIMQPTTFFRKKKLYEVGLLDLSLNYAMDWDLWCRFAKADAQVKYLPKILAANRDYPESKTKSGGLRRLKEIWRLQKRHITGFWPHAFWGFTATEIFNFSNKSNNRINRQLGKIIGYSIALLSPQSVLYSLKKKIKPQTFYGMYPHSTRCQKKVVVQFPFYADGKSDWVEIEFGIACNTLMDVVNVMVLSGDFKTMYLNLELSPTHRKRKVKIPLTSSNIKSNMIDLMVIFDKFDKNIENHIYGIQLGGGFHKD